MNTTTINEHGAVSVDGTVVGWVRKGGCEHENCAAAIAAGRVWHAIPAGFGVALPLYHYSRRQAAVAVLLEAAGVINHADDCPALVSRLELERELAADPSNPYLRGAQGEYYVGDQDGELCECGAVERLWAAVAELDDERPPVGARVRLAHDVDRYPHFVAPAGATGTVVDVGDPKVYAVRLDLELAGSEEWANELHWMLDAGDEPAGDLELEAAAADFVNLDALRAATPTELAVIVNEGGPAALVQAAEVELEQRGEHVRDPYGRPSWHVEPVAGEQEPLEVAEQRTRDAVLELLGNLGPVLGPADAVLVLDLADAVAIADALGYLAGVDEGEHTDYANLLRLEQLVREQLGEVRS